MATTKKGVWDLQQVRDQYLEGLWTYDFLFDTAGPLFSWGKNTNGQLGQNDTTPRSSPVQIPGTQWSFVGGGEESTISIKYDSTMWVWGRSYSGSLGLNNTIARSSPTQIPGTQWSSASATSKNMSAIKLDGTLWSWGYNSVGGLGQNDTTTYSSPRQIPGTQWSKVSVGTGYGAALSTKTDGTLWSWGYNSKAALGQNNLVPYSSPRQIPGTQWNLIEVSVPYGNNAAALKTDGTLWIWGGSNTYGNLGINDGVARSSPTQVPGTQWSFVSMGERHTAALKTDGTLWIWGRNAELGLNNTANSYSSPIQIPGIQWNSLHVGDLFTLATKTDGTLWSWGSANGVVWGLLGVNDTVAYSSPRQIPGTQWSSCFGGYLHSFATKNP